MRTVPFAVFTASTAPLSAKLAERIGTKRRRDRPAWCRWPSASPSPPSTGVDTSYWVDRRWRCSSSAAASACPGAGHGGDHGLAAAGQGRRRLGRQRHGPRARRHARRRHRRQRVLVDLRLPARRRPRRLAGAAGGRSAIAKESVGGRRGRRRAGRRSQPARRPRRSSATPSTTPFVDGWHAGSWVSSPSSSSARSSPGASSPPGRRTHAVDARRPGVESRAVD